MSPADQAARRCPTAVPMALAILAIGLVHRAVQLWLVAAVIARQVALNPGWQSMQYLPTELLEKHFAAAMLYLQQTPPLPNLLVGILGRLATSPELRAIATIAFAGMLSCIAAALLVLLLLRMRVWPPLAFVVALLFLGNGGVVLLEYTAFGQCFYEQLAMVACMLAALAAESLARRGSWSAAAWLGVAVALAALSRATFSYLLFPVLAWLVWQRIQPKYLLAFLAPVMLLHGGWAAKQYAVQGEWLWATSTWGGANAMAGDLKRHGQTHVSTRVDCAARWAEPLSAASIFFSFAKLFPDSDLAGNLARMGDAAGPSPAARAVDLEALAARERWLPNDSASFRELAACVQRMYVRQWLRHPGAALAQWARSYVQFWQPLDSYTTVIPTTLVAVRPPLAEDGGVSIGGALRHWLFDPGYFARVEKMPWFIGNQPRLVHANVVVIPFAPQLFTWLAFAALHGLPFGGILFFLKRGVLKKGRRQADSQRSVFPAGFSFLLLLYLYVAGISNLVEYGENMRFRLPVEPIVWAIGAVAASILFERARRTAARPASHSNERDTAAIP